MVDFREVLPNFYAYFRRIPQLSLFLFRIRHFSEIQQKKCLDTASKIVSVYNLYYCPVPVITGKQGVLLTEVQ